MKIRLIIYYTNEGSPARLVDSMCEVGKRSIINLEQIL
jgi:hypothetical protein